MSKFEQLLDLLVNEDREAASALFHEIVVEKSRGIYESLIAEEEEEEGVDESSEEEDESVEEGFGEEDEETVESMFGEEEGEGDNFPVQDKTDDFEDDVTDHEFGDMGGDMGAEEGDMGAPADKSDIKSIEDALEELKAEFEKLMGGGEPEVGGEEDEFGGEEDEFGGEPALGGHEEDEDEGFAFEASEEEEEDEGVKESRVAKTQGEAMREYIEKVTATMDGGLVGGRTGETMSAPKEGKSPISSGSGKPTSGANAKNIAQAARGEDQDGTSPKGKVGGVLKTGGQFVPSGTKNVAATANTKKPDGAKLNSVGKPGNKEFAGVGAKTGGDKAGQTGNGDVKSPLNGAPNRAK